MLSRNNTQENVREDRRDNQEWTIQRQLKDGQHESTIEPELNPGDHEG